jgi:outer membrane protein TolC
MSNLQRSLYESQRRFDVGMITRADLAQVLAQVAQGQADITQAQSNLTISEAQFYQITGQLLMVWLQSINYLALPITSMNFYQKPKIILL